MNLHHRLLLATLALSVAAHAAPRFERQAVELSQDIFGIDALDGDRDGQLDVVVVGLSKVWLLRAPDWRAIEIADTPGGRSIHGVTLDCDGDGDLDLVISRSVSEWIFHRSALAAGKPTKTPTGDDWTIAWLENTGRADAPWPLHRIDQELHGVHGLWTGDVDRDGKKDLLADSFAGPRFESSLAWFPSPVGLKRDRRIAAEGSATGRPHYLDFADMNGDGRGDLLLGASAEGTFTWWEQPADPSVQWQRHLIAMEPGATHPRTADLNADGRPDVLGSAGHGVGVAWYESPQWRRHVIDADLRDVHAFDAADLDGDGDIDAVGCSFSAKVVRWWENLGAGNFKAHEIDTGNAQEAYDLKVVDLNRDGFPDLLLAGRQSRNAVIYFQGRAPADGGAASVLRKP